MVQIQCFSDESTCNCTCTCSFRITFMFLLIVHKIWMISTDVSHTVHLKKELHRSQWALFWNFYNNLITNFIFQKTIQDGKKTIGQLQLGNMTFTKKCTQSLCVQLLYNIPCRNLVFILLNFKRDFIWVWSLVLWANVWNGLFFYHTHILCICYCKLDNGSELL